VATQLWHHMYIDASLCERPGWTPPAETSGPANGTTGRDMVGAAGNGVKA